MIREVKIGIFGLVAVIILIWGYQFLEGKNIFEKNNTYHVRFDNINQLEVASQVLVNGFRVGSVTKIVMDPEDYTKLIVTIDVNKRIRIPKDSRVVITSSSLVGGRIVLIEMDGYCEGDDCAQSGDFLNGKSLSALGSMLPPEEVSEYLNVLQNALLGTVDSLKLDRESARFANNFTSIFNNLSSISYNLDLLLKNNVKSLTASFDNIESITYALKANEAKIAAIIDNISIVTNSLKSLEIDTLVDKGKLTLASVDSSLHQLQTTLINTGNSVSRIEGLLAGIEEGDGTLGKLIKDEKLYDELNNTLIHTNLLLQDMRLYPGRYFNLSLFKNKQPYQKAENDPAFNE